MVAASKSAISISEERPTRPPASPVPHRLLPLILIAQSLIAAVHLALWWTLRGLVMAQHAPAWLNPALAGALLLLTPSFLVASFVSRRHAGKWARWLYRVAAVWVGLLSYGVPALAGIGAIALARLAMGLPASAPRVEWTLLGIAGLAGAWALVNGFRLRVVRVQVALPNLPPVWEGRVLALVTDVHLGHVRGLGTLRRLIRRLNDLRPALVLIGGDLYDGTAVYPRRLAEPWRELNAAAYFVSGNHEGYTDSAPLLTALEAAGVQALDERLVELDGLQVLGVSYGSGTRAETLRESLERLGLDPSRPSILLTHAPDHPAVAAAAGISLQLSGHTHGGQYFPFTRLARRAYGAATHGLYRVGQMNGYTSFGVGTWGPPLRLGTYSELTLLELTCGR